MNSSLIAIIVVIAIVILAVIINDIRETRRMRKEEEEERELQKKKLSETAHCGNACTNGYHSPIENVNVPITCCCWADMCIWR